MNPDIQKHVEDIITATEVQLEKVLSRTASAAEMASASTDVGLIVPVLVQEIATIKARLDNANIK